MNKKILFVFTLFLFVGLSPLKAQEPMLGEIRLFACNFAPVGWAACEGQLLSIAQNTALFSLLGTTYGGDGRTTFALPDLRGRVPVGVGTGPGLEKVTQGQKGSTSAKGTDGQATIGMIYIICMDGAFPSRK